MDLGDKENYAGKKLIWFLHSSVNIILLIVLMALAGFGAYALWDSNTLSQNALPERFEIYKPEESMQGFDELKSINPDVFGWITVYGTPVDYPLLQAEDNVKYISTNAMGEYSLTGSLFLDCEADRGFSGFSSIIYGHNMTPQVMFGNIKEFKNLAYFESHRYGKIFFGGKEKGLEIFALLNADGYDGEIYRPMVPKQDGAEYLELLRKSSVHEMDLINRITEEDHIVLLSTCSTESTNGRDILLGLITDEIHENMYDIEEEEIRETAEIDKQEKISIKQWLLNWQGILAMAAVLLILTAVIIGIVRKKRNK